MEFMPFYGSNSFEVHTASGVYFFPNYYYTKNWFKLPASIGAFWRGVLLAVLGSIMVQ